jgi:hypothetical protein
LARRPVRIDTSENNATRIAISHSDVCISKSYLFSLAYYAY